MYRHISLLGRLHDHLIPIRKRLIAKGDGNLFQSMVRRLDVVEMRQACREETEARNDEVKVAMNARKGVRGHHADDKVEDPVGGGGQGHALAAGAEREDLGGEEPGHRAPGETVYNVVKHDKGVLAIGFGGNGQACLSEGTDNAQQYRHGDTSGDQERFAAPSVG